MYKVYTVFATDPHNGDWSCVGNFTSKVEAEKCLDWWKEHGDWDRYYVQEYDILKEFDLSLYD